MELSFPLKLIFAVYRPIAWLRLEHNWLGFMPELWLVDRLKGMRKET